MATKISKATGNFTAAATWAPIDSASEFDTEVSNIGTNNGFQYCNTFTPGNVAIDGVAIKIRTIANTTGTVTVILANNTSPGIREGTVTVNVADLGVAVTTPAGWFLFKFASPVTPNGTDVYKVGISSSVVNSVNVYVSVSPNFARMLRLATSTTAPAAGDKLMIMGELTGAGTHNALTVTMDNTTTTAFGPTVSGGPPQGLTVNAYGTLTFGTTASTNYYLRVQGVLSVFTGGTFNIGTTSAPIPATSSTVLEFNSVVNVDTGLEVGPFANFVACGATKWPTNIITAASNATPIQITSTNHSLVAGERITITGVNGNTVANGTWEVIASIDANNFTIGQINGAFAPGGGVGSSTGSGAYTSGGSWTRLAYSRLNIPLGGLVSVTNGSPNVVGIEGQSFVGLTGTININGVNYTIASVTDATHLTLTGNYTGTTANTVSNYVQWIHAATASTITVLSTAGWAAGDQLVFPTTTRTRTQCEVATIASIDSGTQVTLTAPLVNYHGGVFPIQVEVGNITRNVKIRGISTSLQGYCLFQPASIVNCQYAEFSQLGSPTGGKKGIDAQSTTGSCSVTYCALHDFTATSSIGFNISNSASNNITFSNNITWNIATTHFTTAITTGTWTCDANLFVQNIDGNSSILGIFDVGGRCTNNVTVGATSTGITLNEANATILAFSGNTVHGCTSFGISLAGSGMSGTNNFNLLAWRNSNSGFTPNPMVNSTYNNIILFGNTNQNITIGASGNILFANVMANGDISFNTPNGINPYGSSATIATVIFENSSIGVASGSFFTSHTTQDVQAGTFNYGDVTFRNCLFGSIATVTWNGIVNNGPANIIRSQRHNQIAGNHRAWSPYGNLTLDTAIYNVSPPSLRMTPVTSAFKLTSAIGLRTGFLVPVASGASRTITVAVRTSAAADGFAYNGNPPRLILKKNICIGVNADTVLATWSGSAGAWTVLTGVTPAATDDGVFELYIDCDGTLGWINIDDWTSQ